MLFEPIFLTLYTLKPPWGNHSQDKSLSTHPKILRIMGPEGVGRGFVNTNQKVALKLLPVSGPERMPHCSFLKNEEFLKNSLPCFMTIIKYKKQVTCIVLIYPYSS